LGYERWQFYKLNIFFINGKNTFNNSAIEFNTQNINIISKINEHNAMNKFKISVDSNVIKNTTIAKLSRINTLKVFQIIQIIILINHIRNVYLFESLKFH